MTVEQRVALRRRTVLGSAIALAGLSLAPSAFAQDGIVDLKVVDRDNGQELPVWRRDGRLFVAGEQGERYSLRITNHTDGRVLVVMSVDGVNIISGETAGYNGRGYVLGPYGAYDITGWRKSDTEVAAFAFTALPNSYAARTGRPGEVGVIGMAVFKERRPPAVSPLAVSPSAPPPPPPPPYADRRSELDRAPKSSAGALREPPVVTGRRQAQAPADSAPPPPLALPPVEKPLQPLDRFAEGSAPPQRDEKLGTAHGQREWSVSHVVPFVRASAYPQLVRQIEYDSYANLVLAGVIPSPPRPGRPPRAFPQTGSFVPDPPPTRF